MSTIAEFASPQTQAEKLLTRDDLVRKISTLQLPSTIVWVNHVSNQEILDGIEREWNLARELCAANILIPTMQVARQKLSTERFFFVFTDDDLALLLGIDKLNVRKTRVVLGLGNSTNRHASNGVPVIENVLSKVDILTAYVGATAHSIDRQRKHFDRRAHEVNGR